MRNSCNTGKRLIDMDLCNTVLAVAKKSDITSFRLSPAFREAIDVLVGAHGARNLSEYFRGLIYLDAALTSGDTDPLDKPAWVTRDYGKWLRKTVVPSSHSPEQPGHVTKEELLDRRVQMGDEIIHGQTAEPKKKAHRSKAS
jgi:hypothetical protein